jgi:hypothetical protein
MCRKLHNMSESKVVLLAVVEISLSTSLSNIPRVEAHPKFVCVFNANYDGTIFYNDSVPT